MSEDTVSQSDSKYASRKFIMSMLMLIVTTALLVLGYLDDSVWASTVVWLTGLYMAGNAATWFADAFKGKA